MNTAGLILPPGFRFHPTDQELIIHYLRKKVSASAEPEVPIIADVNIYQFNPWDLPDKALFGESEWFFFSPRDRKYPNGARPNRAAASGYWKATGTDKPILSNNRSQCLGVKKSLVFYKGRAPNGTKTDWMMLEYRLLDDNHHQQHRLRGSMRLDDWVLCRVRQKTPTPRQGEECYKSSSGSSTPNTLRSIQGQDMIKENNSLNIYDYCFQNPFLAPLESEEADEQGLVMDFQEASPGYSTSAVDSGSDPLVNSSFKEAIESIKKTLSIGNLEDFVPVSPKRMQEPSPPLKSDNGSTVLQASSPTGPASYLTGSMF